jgi:hypothetical protein
MRPWPCISVSLYPAPAPARPLLTTL